MKRFWDFILETLIPTIGISLFICTILAIVIIAINHKTFTRDTERMCARMGYPDSKVFTVEEMETFSDPWWEGYCIRINDGTAEIVPLESLIMRAQERE